MHKSAIIIFVRNPILGKVKTRIAKTMGNKNALLIYQILLEHTRSVTEKLNCDKFIYYADFINNEDLWDNTVFKKRLQRGEDLGQRMHNAFSELFNAGYARIIIIGSDCYELSTQNLQDAFTKLELTQVVIGPARDGGYYLLGIKALVDTIFEDIAWSTDHVLSATLNKLRQLDFSHVLLPVLNDVDGEQHLSQEILERAGLRNTAL
ncbi:MAG: TIGR04282 family arsenosugar biosynthesis glycosyltransferase [Flavisolibacter sp.]